MSSRLPLRDPGAAASIAGSLEAVLADPCYREAAASIAAASRNEGGAAAAAADLIALAEAR
jgi:UDP:flavonoid glycosyltransferase YjiC (YdhE family)